MLKLVEQYSISEIIVFIVLLAFAVKEAITLIDWFKVRLTQKYNKQNRDMNKIKRTDNKVEDIQEELQKKEKEIAEHFRLLQEQIENLSDNVNLLINSNKEDIKSYIVDRHHYFCYEKHWIDDYSLDCLEKRFVYYEKEGGNSFIEGLMNEVRALPKVPPQ